MSVRLTIAGYANGELYGVTRLVERHQWFHRSRDGYVKELIEKFWAKIRRIDEEMELNLTP